jgi:glycogen debranching enzyme
VDGEGRQCDVISSNPGHLLGTGILSRERELEVADRLLEKDMFSGWGIRTLSSSELAYQPMDYQLGSVWPHDSGFCAAQMPKIGRANHAHSIMRGLFDAAKQSPDYRLPELFCGFERESSSAPVRYPVACVPQAWAAGCWLHMMAGCMNIDVDGLSNRVTISAPRLPIWLGTVTVRCLKVGDCELDLEFTPNANGSYACKATRIDGDIDCVLS